MGGLTLIHQGAEARQVGSQGCIANYTGNRHHKVATMRSFEDSQGQTWQAALLDASYGVVLLIFSPMHAGELRRYAMPSENLAHAQSELAAMELEVLQQLLVDAEPWDPASCSL